MDAALALLGLLAGGAEPPPPQLGFSGATLTRREAQEMAPDALTRKLFGDMAEMLYPVRAPAPGPGGRARWLSSLEFLTRPRAASSAGLCETDSLQVEFALARLRVTNGGVGGAAERTVVRGSPAPSQNAFDDPPVAPRRITLHTRYFVHGAAGVLSDAPREDDRTIRDESCEAIDPREAPPIFAGSDRETAEGVRLLSLLIEDSRAARGVTPVACTDIRRARLRDEACRDELRHLDTNALISVQTIDRCEATEPGHYCVRLDLRWDRELRLEMKPGSKSPIRAELRAVPSLDEIL